MKIKIAILTVALTLSAACASENGAANLAKNDVAPAKPPTASSTAPTTVDTLAVGRQLYAAACSNCHRETGKGGKITIEGRTIDPDDLTSEHHKKMTDDEIIETIYNGDPEDGMPAFKDKLQEAEIREVVRYVRVELQKMPDTTPAEPSKQPANATRSSHQPAPR